MSINTYEIKKPIAVLSTTTDRNGTRWQKELNLVSWSDCAPQYDIRAWDETHTHMEYGIKLNAEEIQNLYKALQRIAKEYL